MGERGLGMGSVFVHTLTEAYVKCNGMNILRSLNIAERSWVSLCMDVYGNKQDAAYYTSTNGGMKFESDQDNQEIPHT